MVGRNDWKAAQEAAQDQSTGRAFTLERTEGDKWLVRTSMGDEETGGCVFASDERGHARAMAYGEAYRLGQDVQDVELDIAPR